MTGNRVGISNEALVSLKSFLNTNDITEAHHGDCIGADEHFHNEVAERNINIVIHPPKNDDGRAFCKGNSMTERKGHIRRNKDLVDETDILIAFPPTDFYVEGSGSWSTIKYAEKKKKEHYIIFPNGSIDWVLN